MFHQTFVDTGQATKKPVTVVFSVALQAGFLSLLVLLPLVYTQALPNARLQSMLAAPAPPRPSSQKPPVDAKTRRTVVTRSSSTALIAPVTIPRRVRDIQEVIRPPDLALASGTGEPYGTADTVIGVLGSLSAPSPLTSPPVTNVRSVSRPLRVATGVAEANLVQRVMPAYPPLAKAARVQGTVEFTAIISKEGVIERLQLLRGHALLVQAARDAVLQWRYRPTLLNGLPVEVTTRILVNFTLAP
jgi:periplasmic protein TonB